MPRRGNVPKREILPDPMYNSVLVTKLINGVMLDGKKGCCLRRWCTMPLTSSRRSPARSPLTLSPSHEQHHARSGGKGPPCWCATYQVPIEVRPARRQTLAQRWLVDYSRKRSEKT